MLGGNFGGIDLKDRVFEMKYFAFDNKDRKHSAVCQGGECPGWECYGTIDPLYMSLTGTMEHGMHLIKAVRKS